MQRGDDPRVSDPVLDTLEIPRPRTGFANSTMAAANVEHEVSVAYGEHALRLRAFAVAAIRDGEAADDLLQETFLRFVVELKAGRRPDNVGGWLHRVLSNLIISRGRRRSVANRMLSLLVRRDAEPSPEDQALLSERDRTLALALSRLPPDARVAILLAARGMGSAEIGVAIHRGTAATRTYLCRARVRLRDEMSALGVGPDK